MTTFVIVWAAAGVVVAEDEAYFHHQPAVVEAGSLDFAVQTFVRDSIVADAVEPFSAQSSVVATSSISLPVLFRELIFGP